ncbi:c-type cytochrome [Flavobacterium sp. 3HN19-14]|uniref:c-type cytochrome n=1 Tax=Flavobacterium sp. 3HN19-14 TaxID=3448133 RepID=UPI003EE2F4A8
MKKIYLLVIILSCFACKKEAKKDDLYPTTETAQTPEQLGQEIFDGKGNCYSCHQTNKKIIGQGIQEIAKMYKGKNGQIVSFLKEESYPIVDPAMYATMKTNFAVTKNFTDEELKALEAYILSNSK